MSESQRSTLDLSAGLVLRWMGRAFLVGLFAGSAAAIVALLS